MAKTRRKVVEVDVERVDNLLESAKTRPLEAAEAAELKTDFHAMMEALLSRDFRTSEKTRDVLPESGGKTASDSATQDAPAPEKKKKTGGGGHGRHGVDSLPGAVKVPVPHGQFAHKCECPECGEGKLYPIKEPSPLVRFKGHAPIEATVYELERLRCNRCLQVFTAAPPAGVGSEKYDESVAAAIALMKYGAGMPFRRLETLQRQAGVLLSVSTQWDLVRDAAAIIAPVHDELIRQAAQGQVLHNDDTSIRIIELNREHAEHRTGVFTTGIVSEVGEHKIALFKSGWRHAGENLDVVLERRAAELPPPIQMSDALSRNRPKVFSEKAEILIATCLVHGRRNFVDVANSFPDECSHVLDALGEVYATDAQAKLQGLSDPARLALHRAQSEPVMKALRLWMQAEMDANRVEPNSSLGKAMKYMLTHWNELTLFLRVAGAPLDNNIVERALKKAILHRKNSLYYRTEDGAKVGDLFMSLIHTCELNGCNAFDYLLSLLRHAHEISSDPSGWMPWTYEKTLAEPRAAPS